MPDQNLTVSIVQQSLAWQAPQENRGRFEQWLQPWQGKTDLVVLPEMFTAGFSMDARKVAEPPAGETLQWMSGLAAELGAVVTGSYAVATDEGPVNRLIWMRPDGTYQHYDKRHLFRMAGEHKKYRAGSERIVVELNGWKVCPMVCYDLRFPVWCRNRSTELGLDYDLLLFVANWPAKRSYHWSQLLRARAIENLACVVGVNRIGEDGNGHLYSGDSAIIDVRGQALADPGSEAGVFTVTLEADELNSYRESFPAWLDSDDFELLED
ncbi:amidohydrolase [Pseudomaricurvus alkylphenolicus]|uniref:amidohydrolase n=1 Tax=Pseudomaricurvus alkylphenolicus TaxID=1306991 RepID=UPI001420F0A4|nr:amidohydrolase [Pseudomaricurvus alkylphenolicus]